MDYATLQEYIQTILYDQLNRYPNIEIDYSCKMVNSTWIRTGAFGNFPPQFESVVPHHENMDLLLKLYFSMPDERWEQQFIEILRFFLVENKFCSLKYFYLEFLVKTHNTEKIFFNWSDFHEYYSLKKLGSLIYFEPSYFSREDFIEIQHKIEEDPVHDMNSEEKRILDLIMTLRYEALRSVILDKENPEINFDVERVKKEISSHEFPEELNNLLSEIQSSYLTAHLDTEFNDVIDKVRKFLDNLEKEISDRISAISGKEISKGKKPGFGRRRQFLRERGLINTNELHLLKSIYGISSEEGTHSLKSSKEHARICKNIAVEIGLLLLKRFCEWEEEIAL